MGRTGNSSRRRATTTRDLSILRDGLFALLRDRLPNTNRDNVRHIDRFGCAATTLLRLLVDVALARVVAERDRVLGDLLHVLGQERNLAAATRCIDDEVRHRET